MDTLKGTNVRKKKRPLGPYKHPLEKKLYKVHFRVDDALLEALTEYSAISRMSRSEFIREIINTHLENEHSFLKMRVIWAKRDLIEKEAQLKNFRAEHNIDKEA